ncbi:unnamed protein product [Brassica rapa subsp. trilocularis]
MTNCRLTYDGYRQLVCIQDLLASRDIKSTMVEENEMNMSKPTSPFEPDQSHMEKHVCLGSSFVSFTLSYPRLVHFGRLISEVAWVYYVIYVKHGIIGKNMGLLPETCNKIRIISDGGDLDTLVSMVDK